MHNLFAQYANAFNQLDATSIANFYSLPCFVADGDGDQVFSERQSLINKFANNCHLMTNTQFEHCEFVILDDEDLGGKAKAVNVAWRVINNDSTIEFRAFYVCHLVNQRWTIFNASVYPGTFVQKQGK